MLKLERLGVNRSPWDGKKFKHTECLAYLESKFNPSFIKWMQKYYRETREPFVLAVVLLQLYDPNRIYKSCIFKTIENKSNLRVCLRIESKQERWQTLFLYRVFMIRTFQELKDAETEPFRIDAYRMVIKSIKKPENKCVTIDRYAITVEDSVIWFNMEQLWNQVPNKPKQLKIWDDFTFTDRLQPTMRNYRRMRWDWDH